MPRAVGPSLRAAGLLAVPFVIIAVVGATLAGAADERLVVSFFVTLTLALSIQLFSGPTGILSFGHVAFMGVGAYVAAILMIPPAIRATVAPGLPGAIHNVELPLWVAMPGAFIAAGLVAGIIGLVFARMEETAMSMATVSLLLMFGVLFEGADDLTGGAQGLYAIPRDTTMWLAVGVAVAMVAIGQAFARSRIGLQLKASRSEPLAARSLGVPLIRLRWLAWTLSGALIGLGGAVWAGYAIAFAPREFGLDLTFSLLAALVVGGIASVTGTVCGVAILTVLFEILRRIEADVGITGGTQIAAGLIILAILYRRPEGVFGHAELPEALTSLRARISKPRRPE